MNILVFNIGSGSYKCSLYQFDETIPYEPRDPNWKAVLQTTGPDLKPGEMELSIEVNGKSVRKDKISSSLSPNECCEKLAKLAWEDETAILKKPDDVNFCSHRVVHGGSEFSKVVEVTDSVIESIERYAAFAPLHNRANLEGIKVSRSLLKCPQLAVFDTAFHRTISKPARTYAGPFEWLDKGIEKYGFHGSSFRYAAERAATLLGKQESEPRLIICHLGGGCSLAATVGGKSIETTMGFTPLDGLAMCTRSGSIDPGILFYLLRENGDIDHLEKVLNKESGLHGLSGLVGDSRIILAEVAKGNDRARLAMDVFLHRLKLGIGQMLASLQAMPHAIVFTDAMGEDEPLVRSKAVEPFEFLGWQLDEEKNKQNPPDTDLATLGSAVRILLIKSREDWQIAKESFCFGKNNT